MSGFLDEPTVEFLRAWTPRYAQCVADIFGDLIPGIKDEGLYVAALTVGEVNTDAQVTVWTEERFKNRDTSLDEELGQFHIKSCKWSPNEWEWFVGSRSDAFRLAHEPFEFYSGRYDYFAARGVDDADAYFDFWHEESARALVNVLTSDQVGTVFKDHGVDPVLFVFDTDDGDQLARKTLPLTNPSRDDELYRSVYAYFFEEE